MYDHDQLYRLIDLLSTTIAQIEHDIQRGKYRCPEAMGPIIDDYRRMLAIARAHIRG